MREPKVGVVYDPELDIYIQFCCLKHTPQWKFMPLCKACGCKRCPHATDCGLDCTQSNEPGQEGSVYA